MSPSYGAIIIHTGNHIYPHNIARSFHQINKMPQDLPAVYHKDDAAGKNVLPGDTLSKQD
jgi:hypothetical protein